MKMKRLVSILLVLVLTLSMVFCMSGCGNKASNGVTVQIGPNPETLDPALNSAVDGGNMLITLFETLLIIDENNQVQPGQAESYTVSDDGLTWTFTMRDGLKWSDGTDLNAKDFEYTFKRLTNPDLAAPYAETVIGMIDGYQDAIGNPDAEGKTTTDPDPDKLNVAASEDGKTLTIKLAYPCSYFDKIVAFGTMSPVQKATVEENGDAWATQPDTYVCNGPYMISEWTPSERIVCKKNPNYKGGWDSSRIVTENLNFLLLEDSSASYAAYNSGEALLIKDVPTEEIPSLKKAADGGDFYVDTILGTYYLSMNLNKEPFNNVNVRKALNLAIDRDYIANVVMQGTYSPAYNFMGPGVVDSEGMFFDNAVEANGGKPYISEDYEANLEEAKKALADAGYPNGEGFPTITYSTNDTGYHVAVAEYLQEAYKQIGITMQIDKVEWASFTPQRRAGEYEMARNGWVMDYNDASNMLELLYSTNGNNDGKYNNPDYDAAINASKVADPKAHFEALHNAETIMMNDYACIPLAYYNDFWLQSPKLKGTWHSPYGYWYFQYAYVEG
ncbi:peptide ABC transporter substrate-binding protein [Yeguia hominis]|uniref:Peptide ABC transporter substrate-binding protein n=1 Tax=Yeguia hominis TaxID=2763662 RepID=A0A926DBL2_9FIRM|nr:peptide ABC transporter substrate-binding protein [Yeguia hominis]MBC8534819.1 peptide ABC transporter substrate-binding protein [Yeguia hominis]